MKQSDWLNLPMGVFFALYVGAGFTAPLISHRFWTARASWDEPPWHFIGQDLVSGLLFCVALALSVGAATLMRRHHPERSRQATFFALLWMGYPVAQAILVLLRTNYVWDPSRATSHWRTFDEYIADPARYVGFGLAMAIALFYQWVTRARARDAPPPPSIG
jgi:hypothetical protein